MSFVGQLIVSKFHRMIPMVIGRVLVGSSTEAIFLCQLKIIFALYSDHKAISMSVLMMINRFTSTLAYLLLPGMAERRGWIFTLDFCTYLCLFCFVANLLFIFLENHGHRSEFLRNIKTSNTQVEMKDHFNPKNEINQNDNENENIEINKNSKEVNENINERGDNEEETSNEKENFVDKNNLPSNESFGGKDIINNKKFLDGLKFCFKSIPFLTILLICTLYFGCFLSFMALAPIYISKNFHLDAKHSSFISSLMQLFFYIYFLFLFLFFIFYFLFFIFFIFIFLIILFFSFGNNF